MFKLSSNEVSPENKFSVPCVHVMYQYDMLTLFQPQTDFKNCDI